MLGACCALLVGVSSCSMAQETPVAGEGASVELPDGASSTATLRFLNDDRLNGTLQSFSANSLTLQSPTLRQAAAFPIASLHELVLPYRPELPNPNRPATAVVTLTNGDTVHGQLAGANDAVVSLDTPFAGRLNFNRLMVGDVRIVPADDATFVGPTGLEGWSQTSAKSPPWEFQRGSFRTRSSGGIGRLDLLGDANRIAFDLAWKGESLGFKLKWFTTTAVSNSGKSGYEFTFQRGSVYLRNRNAANTLGNVHLSELLENTRVRLEIRSDRRSGKTCLYVNDRMIDVWTDPDARTSRFGSGLQFHSTNQTELKLENLRISPWDGVVTDQPDPQAGMFNPNLLNQLDLNELNGQPKPEHETKPETPPGRMELANGDSIDGQVKSVDGGTITLATPLGEVTLPVDRLRSLALKPVSSERCIRRSGDVRAHFSNGSSLVFRLDSATPESLSGSSQNFGTASFLLKSIERIEFNIYPKLRESRPKSDW